MILKDLIAAYAKPGKLVWIGLRDSRRVEMDIFQQAEITEEGLLGDHGRHGKRAVTLMQSEHLPVIGSYLEQGVVAPAFLRRNLVVDGINLAALKGRQIQIGQAMLELTVICAPCSRMEEQLGPGGYSAVRSHGGWCASVVKPGLIALGDSVTSID